MMQLRGQQILITGGAGFIGSELVRQVAACDAQVVVVDNLVNGNRENLTALPSERVRLEVVDIRDSDRMNELMQGVDIIYHLACLGVRHSIHAPLENHEVNASATLQLLATARKVGVGRFVYVSSSEVYGTAQWAPMTEDHPTFPMTVYGASKLAGECYARAFHRTYGYPAVMVRPFNSYGPHCHHEGDSGEVIPKFMLRCMAGRPLLIFGDGSQTRDFTFVSDTARGILLAGLADNAVGQTINIGQGAEITINALATEVTHTVGRGDIEIVHKGPRPGDVLRLYADSSRAQQLLDFQPQVSLHQGLKRLHTWYKDREQTPEEFLENEIVQNWQPLT